MGWIFIKAKSEQWCLFDMGCLESHAYVIEVLKDSRLAAEVKVGTH